LVMAQRNVPVSGSVRTSKKTGRAHSVSSHSRKVDGVKDASKGVVRREGAAASAAQLADGELDVRDVRGHRLSVASGQLAIFDPALVERETLVELVASGDAVVIPVGAGARVQGRFDRSYGGDELCEVTVNGNDGYDMLGGVEAASGQVVVCDPSLVFDDSLYGEALTAAGSRRGSGVIAGGRALCFTTYGNGECLADVFGDRGRFLIREDDGDDGSYEGLYDADDGLGFDDDFY
jgi:hypothetical protein